MNPQREPFTDGFEPFTDRSPSEIVIGMTESNPNGMMKAPKSVRRVKMTANIPSSLAFRLESVIVAERRQPHIVMEKVVGDFLSNATNEPRPYIPAEIRNESTKPCAWSIDSNLVDGIKSRAIVEGRDYKILVVRAIYDYVRNSPDDPGKVEPKVEPRNGLDSGSGSSNSADGGLR